MRPSHLLLISAYLYLHHATATCFFPNGSADASGKTAPCSKNGNSMCCLTNVVASDADTCRPDGLCTPSDNSAPFRDTCTDSTWTDPACLNLCNTGTDDFGNTSDSVYMALTTCADGSYCCGFPWNREGPNCCQKKEGRFIENGKVVTTPPASASATSQVSPASTTVVPQLSATPLPPSSDSSSNNTGAIVGGVVGGVAAIAILGLAFWYFMIRRSLRKNQQHHQLQQQGGAPSYEPYQNTQPQSQMGEQKIWPQQGMGEMGNPDGGFRAGELDAREVGTTNELDGRQAWGSK